MKIHLSQFLDMHAQETDKKLTINQASLQLIDITSSNSLRLNDILHADDLTVMNNFIS